MAKSLKLEILVAAMAIASVILLSFESGPYAFGVGVVLAVSATLSGVGLKISGDKRKKEICIEKGPRDWIVEKRDYWKTCLEIEEREHGKGSSLNVRWEFEQYQHYDLEHIVDRGKVIIKYRRTNYPYNPKIRLRVFISGR